MKLAKFPAAHKGKVKNVYSGAFLYVCMIIDFLFTSMAVLDEESLLQNADK